MRAPIFRAASRAEVAELADALDSGSSARKGVGVQIPLPHHRPLVHRPARGLAPSPRRSHAVPPDRLGRPHVTTADSSDRTVVAQNRRARHDYVILETLEAGLVLTGTEVKSLRGGKASLAEAYATVESGEAFVLQLHIPPYEQGNRCEPGSGAAPQAAAAPRRDRRSSRKAVDQKGHTHHPAQALLLARARQAADRRRARARRRTTSAQAIAERDATPRDGSRAPPRWSAS